MRLHFPNKEHDDMLVAHGETSIGAASDNSLVLDRPGISPHHASISVGDRGYVLSVIDPNARAHVNARPVREKAILRLGDVVSLDTLQFMLKPDRDASIRTDVPTIAPTPPPPGEAYTRTRSLPPKAVLRGVSGSYFGKIVPLRGRLVIGRGSDCDLVLDEPEMSRRHAVIENSGDGLYLRDLGSSNGTYVNGVQVRNAVLHPDDQIAFDQNRFLLEAPGLPSREQAESFPNTTRRTSRRRCAPCACPRTISRARRRPIRTRNDIWWLIGAAALIGMGIALLLLVKL
jgi:FOG: FHA domain